MTDHIMKYESLLRPRERKSSARKPTLEKSEGKYLETIHCAGSTSITSLDLYPGWGYSFNKRHWLDLLINEVSCFLCKWVEGRQGFGFTVPQYSDPVSLCLIQYSVSVTMLYLYIKCIWSASHFPQLNKKWPFFDIFQHCIISRPHLLPIWNGKKN